MAKHFKAQKKPSILRAFFKFIFKVLLIVIIAAAGLLGYLTYSEFNPEEVMEAEVSGEPGSTIAPGDTLTVMTWNIGYAALGDNADFFMDGGKSVTTASNDRVLSNMSNIASGIKAVHPDIVMIQEIDRDSTRSHHINEFEWFRDQLGGTSSFANNFKVAFLPYPIPPIGKVDSGIATFTSYPVASAERVQLPVPFQWPVRIANLKRCVLVSRIPLDGTDKELVLFNLHLEAYDDGSGKTAQTKMLAGLLKAETDKGNYVIAGGDFNQIFSSEDTSLYPAQPGKWQAGEIDVESFGKGWQFLMDEEVPTCRSLDQPYDRADKDTFQYYLIDGFIVSGNIKVDKLATQDLGFVASDHNPVVMTIELKGE